MLAAVKGRILARIDRALRLEWCPRCHARAPLKIHRPASRAWTVFCESCGYERPHVTK